jgi:hypothetical protein
VIGFICYLHDRVLTFICLRRGGIFVWPCKLYRTVTSRRGIDRYWYEYRVSRDAFLYPLYALRKHVWMRGLWGLGKQWTEKKSFSSIFYNRYKIFHTCHTYCCYAYHFYAYWLYSIYVWHAYVSSKTYEWFGSFIIKYGKYTFTFLFNLFDKVYMQPAW